MVKIIEPEKMSEEELKQELYELNESGGVETLLKKALRERYNYSARQLVKISEEGEL